MRNMTAMAAAVASNIAFWWWMVVADSSVAAAVCAGDGRAYFCYYLGFSITTCRSTPAGIRDLTS